jgi:hypothetical protein
VKKKMTKVTYICRSAKKKVVTCFIFIFIFYRFFLKAFLGRFVTGEFKNTIFFFPEKIHLGSSQKMRLFFPPFFFLHLGCFVRFFFNRVFGRFVTRGVQKRDKKKSRENLLSCQKKYLLTYVTFFFFFSRPPLCPITCVCRAWAI